LLGSKVHLIIEPH